MKWSTVLILGGFLSAAVVLIDVMLGHDPDWFNWADLLGLHHESLFIAFMGVGILGVILRLRGR